MAMVDSPGGTNYRNAVPQFDSYKRHTATPNQRHAFLGLFFSVFSADERRHWNAVFNGQVSLYKPPAL